MLFGQEVIRDRFADLNGSKAILDAVLSGKVKLSEFELRSVMDRLKVMSEEEK